MYAFFHLQSRKNVAFFLKNFFLFFTELSAQTAAQTLARRKFKRHKSIYGTMRYGFTAGLEDLVDCQNVYDEDEQAMEDILKGVPATMAARRSLK